jgi:hypothetical protein
VSVKANPTTAAQNWVNGMSAAGPKYTAGVQAVKVAPGQLAAAKSSFWASQVAQSQNKFATNVAKVTLSAWQQAAETKGAPRLASGAAAAQTKFNTFMTNFLPALSNVVNGLPAGGTFEQNMARFSAYATALHQQAGSF